MVVAFPSDEKSRSDGFTFGGLDGVNCNCLTESVLQLLLHNKMIKSPNVDASVTPWKREVSDEARQYLCAHDDERLWPMQRDENNRICDVYRDQHSLVYVKHKIHSEHTIHYLLKHFAGDAVHISPGVRAIVHTRFDLLFHDAKNTEGISDAFCRDTNASIPPAEFRLYQDVGSTYAGQQYVPLFSASTRSAAKASTRRANKERSDDTSTKVHANSMAKGIVATTPTFLDIVPLDETTITDTHFAAC